MYLSMLQYSNEMLYCQRLNRKILMRSQAIWEKGIMGQVGCAVGQFFVNLILPMINKQNSNMTDLVSLLSNSVGKSGQGEKEKENKPEEPKLVEIRDFHTEVDDAVTVFATGTRNALRPFCCPPENYWGKMDRSVTILVV